MTTAAEVKRLARPLIDRHGDLALVGRLLVLKPVHHVLRAIVFDRTRAGDQFKPKWLAMYLFEPFQSVWLNLGRDIYRPKRGLWMIADPATPALLIQAVEKSGLPKLRPLETLRDFVALMAAHDRYGYVKRPLQKVIVDVAMGDLEGARSICRDTIQRLSEATYGRDEEDKAQLRRLKELCARLAADDRPGLAKLLHEWEAITVKNLKLEHLWEPTPFPLEQQAGGG